MDGVDVEPRERPAGQDRHQAPGAQVLGHDEIGLGDDAAPDTRIEQPPVRLGQREWTGVIGVLEGPFTEPTGKAFALTMATIGHWTDAGVMDEEFLFRENQDFMRRIGLAQ